MLKNVRKEGREEYRQTENRAHTRTCAHTGVVNKDWLRHRVPEFQDALGGVINTPFLKHKSWGNISLDWQMLS